jgi:hypothetical protein
LISTRCACILWESKGNIMLFQITSIEFDFEDSEGILPEEFQTPIIEDVIGEIWEAEDEDDLVEEITCATGWCIKSLDYRIVLS